MTFTSIRTHTAVLLALLVLVAMAACSSSDDGSAEGAATEAEPVADVATSDGGDEAGAAEDTPAGTPTPGGRLVIGIADESALGFDPSTSAVGPGGGTIALAIYDTLAAFAEDGSVVPYLAESIEPNGDATQWTVTLREGVTFHDGTPVDAAAVKHTFDANDTAGRPLAPGYSTEVVDDRTITFTFQTPYGTFMSAVATQFSWIKSPTAEEELGEEFTNSPVGSGPYRFGEWVRDDHLTLVRNEDYWRDDVALLDEVEMRVIPDDAVRLAALEAGDVDAIVTGTGDIATLRDSQFQTHETTTGVNAVVLNNAVAPFDDVRVRRGLAHALDYQAIIDTVWGGVGSPAEGPIPADNPFYTEPEGYPTFDLAQATSLIEEYEAESGTDVAFSLTFLNDPLNQELAQLLQSYWVAAGADVELAPPVGQTDIFNLLATQEYEAATYEIAGFIDPDIWSYYLFHSSSFLNLGAVASDALDQALDAGHEAVDSGAREQAYADLMQTMADEVPWIFLRDQVLGVAAADHVRGIGEWTLPDGSPGTSKQFWLPFTLDSLWVSS